MISIELYNIHSDILSYKNIHILFVRKMKLIKYDSILIMI